LLALAALALVVFGAIECPPTICVTDFLFLFTDTPRLYELNDQRDVQLQKIPLLKRQKGKIPKPV